MRGLFVCLQNLNTERRLSRTSVSPRQHPSSSLVDGHRSAATAESATNQAIFLLLRSQLGELRGSEQRLLRRVRDALSTIPLPPANAWSHPGYENLGEDVSFSLRCVAKLLSTAASPALSRKLFAEVQAKHTSLQVDLAQSGLVFSPQAPPASSSSSAAAAAAAVSRAQMLQVAKPTFSVSSTPAFIPANKSQSVFRGGNPVTTASIATSTVLSSSTAALGLTSGSSSSRSFVYPHLYNLGGSPNQANSLSGSTSQMKRSRESASLGEAFWINEPPNASTWATVGDMGAKTSAQGALGIREATEAVGDSTLRDEEWAGSQPPTRRRRIDPAQVEVGAAPARRLGGTVVFRSAPPNFKLKLGDTVASITQMGSHLSFLLELWDLSVSSTRSAAADLRASAAAHADDERAACTLFSAAERDVARATRTVLMTASEAASDAITSQQQRHATVFAAAPCMSSTIGTSTSTAATLPLSTAATFGTSTSATAVPLINAGSSSAGVRTAAAGSVASLTSGAATGDSCSDVDAQACPSTSTFDAQTSTAAAGVASAPTCTAYACTAAITAAAAELASAVESTIRERTSTWISAAAAECALAPESSAAAAPVPASALRSSTLLPFDGRGSSSPINNFNFSTTVLPFLPPAAHANNLNVSSSPAIPPILPPAAQAMESLARYEAVTASLCARVEGESGHVRNS